MRALTEPQRRLLAALASGGRLKDLRTIDGAKTFTLSTDAAGDTTVDAALVEALLARGLIDSNKKFPGATYWLTEAGKRAAAGMAAERRGPLNT